jgi:hypothetical protein
VRAWLIIILCFVLTKENPAKSVFIFENLNKKKEKPGSDVIFLKFGVCLIE